ncbi:hypothetical protein HWV62_13938 [Athelia sp. TMB]|nr:hypothetical protein HWV62_13938 [Athelia sp. TMB]
MQFGLAYWHWFFLVLPAPYAENIIMADPMTFWQGLNSRGHAKGTVHTEEALQHYQSAYFNRDAVHASCEDYRAAASIDLEHDRADREANHKLKIPALRVLWGKAGVIETYGDVVGVWKNLCDSTVEVSGRSVQSGHYIAEERSEELLQEIFNFMQ